MSDYQELLLGCGNSRGKRVYIPGREYEHTPPWKNLTTLDIDPACKPDIVFDLYSLRWTSLITEKLEDYLNEYPTGYSDNNERDLEWERRREENKSIKRRNEQRRMPDNSFDEIHAYEVLEHCGAQGDYKTFFAQFREFWRVLKPNGYFCATVPDHRSLWAWGDPSHTRVINVGTLVFLSKKQYAAQVGKTAMSDYRELMGNMDFDIVRGLVREESLEFVLRAIK